MDFILKEFQYNQNKRNKRKKSLNNHSKERNMSTCPLVRLSAAVGLCAIKKKKREITTSKL